MNKNSNSKSDQLEEETSVSKSFLLIFDYFTYFNKNIELNLPKRKNIQKDNFLRVSLKDLSLTMNGSLTHFWPHDFPLWISMSDSPFPEKFTRWESNPIHEVTLNQMDLQHWQGQNTKSPCNKIFVFQSSQSPNPDSVIFFQLWRSVKVRSLIPSIYVTQCDSSLRVHTLLPYLCNM